MPWQRYLRREDGSPSLMGVLGDAKGKREIEKDKTNTHRQSRQ